MLAYFLCPYFLVNLVHLCHLNVGLVGAAAAARGGQPQQVGDRHRARHEEQLHLVHRLQRSKVVAGEFESLLESKLNELSGS